MTKVIATMRERVAIARMKKIKRKMRMKMRKPLKRKCKRLEINSSLIELKVLTKKKRAPSKIF